MLLSHETDPSWLVVECKASSFGPDSDTSRQALKLLAVGVDLAPPLGLSVETERPGHLTYLLAEDEAGRIVATLKGLQERLTEFTADAAPASAIRLDRDERGVLVSFEGGDPLPAPAAEALAEPTLCLPAEPDDDPRPLYLIPWDPTVEQDPEHARYCRRQLGARVLNAMLSRVGRMQLPCNEVVRMDELVEAATFGVSRYWRDAKAVDQVYRAAQQTIAAALRGASAEIEVSEGSSPIHLQLIVTDEATRDAIIDALDAADELQAGTPLEEPPPRLFDPGIEDA